MTAQREPGSREQGSSTIEESDVGPDLAPSDRVRRCCQMLMVQAEPSRVALQRGDGGDGVETQRRGHLRPGIGSTNGRTKIVFSPTTLPFEVTVVGAETICVRAHGAHRPRRCRDQAQFT